MCIRKFHLLEYQSLKDDVLLCIADIYRGLRHMNVVSDSFAFPGSAVFVLSGNHCFRHPYRMNRNHSEKLGDHHFNALTKHLNSTISDGVVSQPQTNQRPDLPCHVVRKIHRNHGYLRPTSHKRNTKCHWGDSSAQSKGCRPLFLDLRTQALLHKKITA